MRTLFEGFRSVAGRLPPGVLLVLLWPAAFVRAANDVLLRGVRPPTQLPPLPGVTRSRREAMADRLMFRMTPLAGFFADHAHQRPWAARYDISDLEALRPVLEERPVLLVSFHYGGLIMVPSILNQRGVPTALAVNPQAWPLSRLRQWRLDLARIGDIPTVVTAEARTMLRFLRPGRCLVVAVDFPTPEAADVAIPGGTLRVSTAPLRLARVRHALVVPMLAIGDGPWRLQIRLGKPVPDELIAAGDYDAAAAHIAAELLPLAAQAPGQALPTLVDAFLPRPQQAGLPLAQPGLVAGLASVDAVSAAPAPSSELPLNA